MPNREPVGWDSFSGPELHRTRVPLKLWFLGFFFLARQRRGISTLPSQRDTGLGDEPTLWPDSAHRLDPKAGRDRGASLPAPIADGD